MQGGGEKEKRVDDAEEALTLKTEPISDHPKKEVTKEGKFAFRKMKQPKKEKSPKKPVVPRFEGEGIVFKAKLIGVEAVADARGDKMCQDAMQRLKLNVRNTGPHKRKINICVSMQGVKIKDEKFGNVIFHHPVSVISFISQDITDARAFGYVFGSTSEPHQFVAIKTEKPAFHVVLALRDLFQTVLDHKQVEIQNAKEQKIESSNENGMSSENTTINQLLESSQASKPLEDSKVNENIYFEVLLTEPVANKKDIQNEPLPEPVKTVDDLIGLQSELHQLQEGINQMDTSIAAVVAFNTEVHVPENDPFDTSFVLGPKRDSFTLPMPTPVPVTPVAPSIIVDTQQDFVGGDKYAIFSAIDTITPSVFQEEEDEAEEEEVESRVPTAVSPPPKPPRHGKSPPDMSVFADLDPLGKDRPYKDKTEFFQDVKNPPKKVLNDLVDHRVTVDPPPFPVDFVSQPNPFNPLPPSSVPIPIPGGGGGEGAFRERSVSNGYHSGTSLSSSAYCTTDSGSLYSKSPLNESDYSDYYISPSNNNSDLTKQNVINNNLSSRPRPRPSLLSSKGGGLSNPRTVSSHSLSSDSSSDYEAISRESMQSIANALTGRLRAQSEDKVVGDIFARKADPFADDDFFFSLPKKNLLLLQQTTEIPEFV